MSETVEITIVNFNCPVKLLEVFDEAIKGNYNTRTAAILQAMRDMIRELEEQKRQRNIANEKGVTEANG